MTHDGPHSDPLALDNQLCFAVYAASRALTGLYRELLADMDLTYPQYLVMLVLWERDTVRVKDLGAALRLDSGTLSPLLRRLQARGLVRRVRGAEDERLVHVSLTDEGARLRERARDVPERVLCSTDIPQETAAELRTRLDQITRSVGAAADALRAAR
ncbi:DNA-binding MarR family transcriptional regulator [Nocardiopsis mwathae]|uniref:DNA-binding MarR family transcriptional regulator n=1 Tax=Nocardiopsis mwathae TaxID=1472723 RepID=A0A7W9YGU0_9ACTN|nr:MarR family transcriptional regulator [Nocardiopsis mwathae]MBB6171837.1 DNA-binding MarR family transcriptional regulator [Nocardiopsis mwathae]